jgi:hypothetical protein
MMRNGTYFIIRVFIFFCAMLSTPAWALFQYGSLWLSINNQNYLSKDKQWVYLFNSQSRFVNRDHPLETLLAQGSVGYSLNPRQRVWVGYYWADFRPYHHDFQEQRLFEEFYWTLEDDSNSRVATRTRIEENKFTNHDQVIVIWRQMLAREMMKLYFGHLNPLFYEEMFVHLNNPTYASRHFLNENRVFIGFNYYISQKAFWRIGYINQLVMGTPHSSSVMMHVLAINYTFGVPKISLPIDN